MAFLDKLFAKKKKADPNSNVETQPVELAPELTQQPAEPTTEEFVEETVEETVEEAEEVNE